MILFLLFFFNNAILINQKMQAARQTPHGKTISNPLSDQAPAKIRAAKHRSYPLINAFYPEKPTDEFGKNRLGNSKTRNSGQ
jgi:hypothetical protein